MNPDHELECPYCNESFTKGEAAWTVCLTCGRIYPPGVDFAGHGPGPGAYERGEADVRSECCIGVSVYSEKRALERQDRARTEPHKFTDADVAPPWERGGFEEAWTPGERGAGDD